MQPYPTSITGAGSTRSWPKAKDSELSPRALDLNRLIAKKKAAAVVR